MSQSTKPAGGKARRSLKKDNANLFKDGFNWDKYLQLCNLPAAPRECFTQSQDDVLINNFKIEDKIEAQDPRNPTVVCLSTVVALQGPRILIRLDGGDACNDFWRLVDAGDIYPLGTAEAKGEVLHPPLGFTKNMSTWTSFLAKNREKGSKASKECFYQEPAPPDINLFEIGMKLEAVDRKNPDLICPATVGDIKADQVFVSFDGWRGAMDYWCHYASRELFPVGWCQENEHPLSSPGNRGDNPTVVERLKLIAEESKRKTRSVAGSMPEPEKITTKIRPETPPVVLKHDFHSKGTRGRMRGRNVRSLTPLPKLQDKIETGRDTEREVTETSSNIATTTATESSGESETCDSSASSHESSDSSSSDNEETKDEEEKNEDDADSEIDESVVEVKQQPTPVERNVSSSPERKDRKRRKKNKKRLKQMRDYSKGAIVEGYGERKRYASAGDEEHYVVRMKKRKKNKRKHSESSMYESPQKRILGFGNQSASFSNAPQQTPTPSIQSPSFIDHSETPTSLFGFNRDEIVKKATEGWPSRLMGSSKMVVTSDNKLARFGQNIADSSCQTSESDAEEEQQHVETANVEVSTATTTITQTSPSKPKSPETPKAPDSTTPERAPKISSQTVSSTTNPPQSTPEVKTEIRAPDRPPRVMAPVPAAPRQQRSRNPQRWNVHDVVDYVREREPALVPHVHLFEMHEIDGEALLLLNSSIAVKYMSMKLGPALKLANLVEQLKKHVPPPRGQL